MKNHYVSQFIIKKFSQSINVYDTHKKNLLKNMSTKNIFCKNEFYEDNIEIQLAQKLEGPFSRLLDEKILNVNSIKLTREEVLLVKRFALLDSVRTHGTDFFVKQLKCFTKNAVNYIELIEMTNKFNLCNLNSIEECNLSSHEFYMNTLKMYIECQSANEMLIHENVTKETYCWAKVFLDSYLSFLDCADNQQFILTDCGMISEYEPSHIIFAGLDISKFSYLHSKLNDAKDEKQKYFYSDLLIKNQIMFENFDIFNLSATRSLVLINPFFKLYDNNSFTINGNEPIYFDKPDIWPTFIETKSIIKTPIVKYRIQGLFLMDDIFSYTPIKLSKADTVHINSLFLQQTQRFIGYDKIEKIIDSLYCHSLISALNQKGLYENDDYKTLEIFIDGIINAKYAALIKQYQIKPNYLFVHHYPDHFSMMAMQDIKQNKYLISYLLSNEEVVKTMNNFSFMGPPDKRIDILKNDLKKCGA